MLIKNNGVTPITMNLRDGTSYLLQPGVATSVPDAATTMIDDSPVLIALFNAGTLTVTTDAGGAFSGFPTVVNATDSAVGKLLQVHAKVGSGGARTLVDSTGQAVGGGSGLSRLRAALSAVRLVPSPIMSPALIAPTAYATGQAYKYDDVVVNGGNIYRCTKQITTSATAPTGTSTLEIADANGLWLFEDVARITTSASAPTVTIGGSNPIASPVVYDMTTSFGRGSVLVQGGYAGGTPQGGIAIYPTQTLAAANGSGSGPGGTTAAVTFETPAAKVAVSSFYGQQMRTWVDGTPVSIGGLAGAGANPSWYTFDFSNAGGAQRRRFRFELLSGSPIFSFAVDSQSAIWAPRSAGAPRALVMGCSYEQGVNGPNISTPGRSWPSIACRDILGIEDCIAAGVGGSGYLTAGTWPAGGLPSARIAEVAQASADILLVGMWGINDPNGQAASLTAAALSWIQAVRAANPGLLIVAFGIPLLNNDSAANVKAREAAIQSAYVTAGAGLVTGGAASAGADSLLWFVPIAGNLDGGPISAATLTNMFQAGNVHPNDWGHRALGWWCGRQVATVINSY